MPIVHDLKEYATEHELVDSNEKTSRSDVGAGGGGGFVNPPPNLHAIDDGEGIDSSDDIYFKMSRAVPDLAALTADAAAATAAEHKMTLREGLRLYPKAICWSMLLSLAIVMEGYDTILLATFYALPEFKKHYGVKSASGHYEITPAWQAGLSNGAQIGEILGLFINGIIAEKYGYRITMMCALIGVICAIFLAVFAVNIKMLLVAEILCGIPWGVFQTLTTTYASEVMPVALRAYLTTYVNLCWVMGQLIGSGVLRSYVGNNTQWAYRIPFCVQWVWAVPILIGVYFAPESPWWLVRHGRIDDAKKSLLRLTSKNNVKFNVDETVAMMRHTNELEKYMTSGYSYWDCFKGVERRRTEIVCMVWMIQTLCGAPFIGFSTYFFVQAGLAVESAFNLSLGEYGIGALGTIGAWGLLRVVGRRALYLWGLVGMLLILIIIGCLGCIPQTTGVSWSQGALVLVFTFVYDITVGPVCYCLVPEIPSTRLRIKSVVLARNAYNLVGIFSNVVMPRMLNPTGWNWKGKAGFFWGAFCLLSLIWTYFRLPEPKGLTYCELDILFEKKASARKFRRFQVILEESGYFSVREDEDHGGHAWWS